MCRKLNMGSSVVPGTKNMSIGGRALMFLLLFLGFTSFTYAQISISFDTTDPACRDLPTGIITANPSGGTAPYTYSWSNGATTQTITGVAPGTYTVTVTDADNATASADATLINPDDIIVNLTSNTCELPFVIEAAVIGGSGGPYTYKWTTNDETATISVDIPGTYCVTVTDAVSCGRVSCITIEGTPLSLDVVANSLSCPGENDGTISAVPIGGTAPFSYSWSNGASTSDISNLAVGDYTVTVTDANGCTAIASGDVTGPDDLILLLSASDPTCGGESDGSISANVSGGTADYSYLWNTGATTQSIDNLVAGTYSVTITDANGCDIEESIDLSDLSSLSLNMMANGETCSSENDGTASVTAEDGVPPYNYNWSTGATSSVISSLAPGTYTVTVTDNVGCQRIEAVNINPANPFSISTSKTDVTTCEGADGTATATVDVGVGPFLYDWSNGDTTATIDNLPAGDYTVTVSDANDCTTTGMVTIIEPPSIFVSIDASSMVCEGAFDGIASAFFVGGTEPVSFLWNTGDTTDIIEDLSAGTYTLTVTDANGCTALDSAKIEESATLSAVLNTTEVVCDGVDAGEADVTVLGGDAPFTYQWNTGASSASISGLGSGDYEVTVTDVNGCTTILSGSVMVLEAINLEGIVEDVNCAGESSGAIRLNITGGVSPFTYDWSNGSTDSVLVDVPAGSYTVVVTDAENCTATATFVVNEPNLLLISLGHNDVVCGDTTTSSASVLTIGGTPPFSYNWSNGAGTSSISGVPAGDYTVTVTDANECETSGTLTIEDPGNPTCAIILTNPVSNIDTNDGEVEAFTSGGMAPYTYLWNTGDTTAVLTGLGPISYSVTVTDALGCETTCSIDLSTTVENVLIGDYIWFDLDHDGEQDDDEEGIAGVKILLTTIDETASGVDDTVTTDANGFYFFEVTPGKYKLTIRQPDSLRITIPNADMVSDSLDSDFDRVTLMTDTIIVEAGDKDITRDAGMVARPGLLLSDPCQCLDNATNNTNGQFSEYLVVEDFLPGDAWTLIKTDGMFSADSPDPPAAPIPIPAGTLIPEVSPGHYRLDFRHIDAIGFDLLITNGIDTLSDVAICFYPTAEIEGIPGDTIDLCINEAPFVPNVMVDIPGDISLFLDGRPITEINPAALGTGSFELEVSVVPFDTVECEVVRFYTVIVTDDGCPAKVGDFAWNDINRDGIQGPDEPGFPGLEVIITPIGDAAASDTTFTDENGMYCFEVEPGIYKITFVEPEEYRITLPNVAEGGDTLDSDPDRVMMMTDTFLVLPGTEDLTWDVGLVPAPGSTDRAGCNCLDNATEQGNGQFSENIVVSGVANDTWRIIDVSGAYRMDSPEPPAAPIPLVIGDTFTQVALGEYNLDFIFVDNEPYQMAYTNGFDTLTASKFCTYPELVSLSSVNDTIFTCINDDAFVPEVTASQDGTFEFLIDGRTVSEINPAALGVGIFRVEVLFTPEDFTECLGVLPLVLIVSNEACGSKVGDYVWNDKDRDGIQDPSEEGIPNVKVKLKQENASGEYVVIQTTETDEDGLYCFFVADPGTYKIQFCEPNNDDEDNEWEVAPVDQGGDDEKDSDADPDDDLHTDPFVLVGGETDLSFDAGFTRICINVDFPGEIGYDQMLCAPGNDPDPIISIRDASGGEGEIEYLWMYSETTADFGQGGFKPIPGAVFPSYDPGPLDRTTYFARCVKTADCPDYLEANIVKIIVKEDAKAEILAAPITCYLSLATFEVVTNTSNAQVQWEFPGGMTASSTTDKVVSASFNSFGYYTVKVTVTENNCTTSSEIEVLATYTPTYCDGTNFVVDASAQPEEQLVQVDWKILNDGADYTFEVKRSEDGEGYSTIAEVTDPVLLKAGYKHYQYIDNSPKRGRNMYRVMMKDPSGNEALSNILDLLLFDPGTKVMVYPNPVQNKLMVEFAEEHDEDLTVELVSAEGTTLRTLKWAANTTQEDMDFSKMSAGVYFIRIKAGDEVMEVMKVLKKE